MRMVTKIRNEMKGKAGLGENLIRALCVLTCRPCAISGSPASADSARTLARSLEGLSLVSCPSLSLGREVDLAVL